MGHQLGVDVEESLYFRALISYLNSVRRVYAFFFRWRERGLQDFIVNIGI
jgi:hypothetical protein